MTPNRPDAPFRRKHRHEREIRLWWDALPVGEFRGRLRVGEWVGPNRFFYEPDPQEPFHFVRGNGETITPWKMYWDGGSIPGIGRVHPDLTKTGFMHAYHIHDWLFVEHDREVYEGRPYMYDCDDAADILAECLKTGEVVGVADLGRIHCEPDVAHLIWTAVRTFPAQQAWDRLDPESLEDKL